MAKPTNVGAVSFRVGTEVQEGLTSAQFRKMVSEALELMGLTIKERAVQLAPMSDIEGHAGTLRRTATVETRKNGMAVAVMFGEGIEYARYQEFGGDGVRVVRHYTTPGTQAHYLRDAGDSVAKEGIKNYL